MFYRFFTSLFLCLFFSNSALAQDTDFQEERHFLNFLVNKNYINADKKTIILDEYISTQSKVEDKAPLNKKLESTSSTINLDNSIITSNAAVNVEDEKSIFTLINFVKFIAVLLLLYTFRGILLLTISKFGILILLVPFWIYQLLALLGFTYLILTPDIITFINSFWVTFFASNAIIITFGCVYLTYKDIFIKIHETLDKLLFDNAAIYLILASLSLYYFMFAFLERSALFSALSILPMLAFILMLSLDLMTRKYLPENLIEFIFIGIITGLTSTLIFLPKNEFDYFITASSYIYGLFAITSIIGLYNPWFKITANNISYLLSFFVFVTFASFTFHTNLFMIFHFISLGFAIVVLLHIFNIAHKIHVLLATGLGGVLLFILATNFEKYYPVVKTHFFQ